ncbi:hypothetical protein [Inhella sp.]|uniref:hypothetical protein n=1 Tax=Inhella sp. TaxID=1921806 RepID=UPI0035B2900F
MAALIRDQMPPSIDWFLGQELADPYEHFREVGKLAIAWCIGEAEQDGNEGLVPVPVGARGAAGTAPPHWFRTLWQSLGVRNVEDVQVLIDQHRLRVITFNYERTFEQFLSNRIRALHLARAATALRVEAVEKQLRDFRVLHVYGDLGDLSAAPLGQIAREIKVCIRIGEITANLLGAVQSAAKRLSVMPTTRSADYEVTFSTARQWISQADRLVFLGFGFDETNLRALGFPELAKRSSQVFATTFGLGAAARNDVCQRITKDWVDGDLVPGIAHEHQGWDIEKYLLHFQPLRNIASS